MSEASQKSGGCHCGAVRFSLNGPARGVVNCHCGQCVTTHGHYAPYSNCRKSDLKITGEGNISWYKASPEARRGFCRNCGSQLFWDIESSEGTSIAAGAFDQPSELQTIGNIFVADKPDYYEITDGLPAFSQGDGGKLT